MSLSSSFAVWHGAVGYGHVSGVAGPRINTPQGETGEPYRKHGLATHKSLSGGDWGTCFPNTIPTLLSFIVATGS